MQSLKVIINPAQVFNIFKLHLYSFLFLLTRSLFSSVDALNYEDDFCTNELLKLSTKTTNTKHKQTHNKCKSPPLVQG